MILESARPRTDGKTGFIRPVMNPSHVNVTLAHVKKYMDFVGRNKEEQQQHIHVINETPVQTFCKMEGIPDKVARQTNTLVTKKQVTMDDIENPEEVKFMELLVIMRNYLGKRPVHCKKNETTWGNSSPCSRSGAAEPGREETNKWKKYLSPT